MTRILVALLAASLAWGADGPTTLEIQVVEGDGAVYPIGSRATRGVTVLVKDEGGRPVDGAIVNFSLPSEGPGGMFASGARTEVASTHADGRAAVWGMQWNRVAGPFEIRITAAKGQARAAIVSSQGLSSAPADKAASSSMRGSGGGHKLLWISLAAAGAAVAGVAGVSLGKSGATATTSAQTAAQIGTPTISLGHP